MPFFDPNAPCPSPFYRVSLKAIVFDEHGRVLLVQEPEGRWEIPGGGWEHGETVEQCLRREIQEELGVEIAEISSGGLYPTVDHDHGEKHYHRLKLAIPVTLASHQFTPGDGMVAAKWATIAELRADEMASGDHVLIAAIERLAASR